VDLGQRSELLEMMLDELAEKGYSDFAVEAALQRSGVTEAAFKAEFADKDGCLFAAYEQLSAELIERSCGSCEASESWPERVRYGLTVLLAEIAARPDRARVLTRVFPAIRPAAYERYSAFLQGFVAYMREGREYSEDGEELPDEVELLAVGAAESLIFAEIDAGRAEELPKMMPEILFSVLVPFLGPDRAADEMRSATAAR
jgi:AcrR family transcriptional regulator